MALSLRKNIISAESNFKVQRLFAIKDFNL